MRDDDERHLIHEVESQLEAMPPDRRLRTWPRYLETLNRDPRLRRSLADIRDEGERFAVGFMRDETEWDFYLRKHNGPLAELADRFPIDLHDHAWAIEALRTPGDGRVVLPLDPRVTADLGAVKQLSDAHADIGRVVASNRHPEARGYLGYAEQVRAAYPAHRRQLELRWLDPILALRRLDDLVLLLSGREPLEDSQIVIRRVVTHADATVQDELLRAVSVASPPSEELRAFAGAMAGEIATILGELRLRAGGRHSRIALIERYKARAEWHERAELRARADDQLLGGKPEERLRDAFARWLFDQGLDPISEPHIAQLRADVLDPFVHPALIVEAKQYRSSNRLKYKVQRGFVQATETAAQLYGPMATDEVFLLIFRRGGDLVAPPIEPLSVGQLQVYIRVVDLVEPAVSGSQSTTGVERLTEAQLIGWLQRAADEAPQDDPEIEAEDVPAT